MKWLTKKLPIPTGETKEITELESWTVSWNIATSRRWGNEKTFNKCFIKESEAIEFRESLRNAANLVKTEISTNLTKN